MDSVVVRRVGLDGEEVVEEIQTREPTGTVDQILDSPNSRRQIDPSKLDFDRKADDFDYDDDDDDRPPPPPVRTDVHNVVERPLICS